MKKTLPFLFVAVAAFVAVWWLNRGDDANASELEVDRGIQLRKVDPREHAAKTARRAQSPAKDQVADLAPETKTEARFGELVIRGRLSTDEFPELQVKIYPQAAFEARESGDFLFGDLEPGLYRVTLFGGEIIPIYHGDIRIEAGKRRTLKFDLEQGFCFRGQVITAYPEEPVPFATVDFNGEGRVRCDAEGFFKMAPLLSRRSLKKITVSAEGWDTQIYHQLSIVDPEEIRIPLGRGSREVTLEIINRTGDEIPEQWTARVTIAPLYTTRREVTVTGSQNRVTIDNLYPSDHYRFELHFPGGEFPIQRQSVRLEHGEDHTTLRFVIEEGIEIEAQAVGPDILKQQTELQLRSLRNVILARAKIHPDGSFLLRHLSPGSYHLFLESAGKARVLQKVTLTSRQKLRFDVDLLRTKLTRR